MIMANKIKRIENKAKLKTYSKRMKSFSKINTFYFILKQKKEKKGGLQKILIRTWLIQYFFTLQLSITLAFSSRKLKFSNDGYLLS